MLSSLFALLDPWLCPPPAKARVAWLAHGTYAHRGLHGPGVPENSPSAFAAAMERGLGIECDVQRTADGQAVVFHDWVLDRLTDEAGPVLERVGAALTAIRLKDGTDTLPSLPEVLHLIGGKVPLLIEVKSRRDLPVGPLCAAVRDALVRYSGPVAVMSFDPRVSRWMRQHSPDITRGLVVSEENKRGLKGMLERHWSLWLGRPEFLAYDIRDLPSKFAQSQRKRGLPLLTWTVRSPELRERAARFADAPIAEGAGVP